MEQEKNKDYENMQLKKIKRQKERERDCWCYAYEWARSKCSTCLETSECEIQIFRLCMRIFWTFRSIFFLFSPFRSCLVSLFRYCFFFCDSLSGPFHLIRLTSFRVCIHAGTATYIFCLFFFEKRLSQKWIRSVSVILDYYCIFSIHLHNSN